MFNNYHRRSIRLKGFDYSKPGLFYITICTQNHVCFFGEIIEKQIILNNAGKMVENEWLAMPNRFQNIRLHEYIIMPNHFHSILEIIECTTTVGYMVDAFKSITTVKYIHGVKTFNWRSFDHKLWQRNYYERVIHDYYSYHRIKQYIIENPANWGR